MRPLCLPQSLSYVSRKHSRPRDFVEPIAGVESLICFLLTCSVICILARVEVWLEMITGTEIRKEKKRKKKLSLMY
jgi:hypothetical protein